MIPVCVVLISTKKYNWSGILLLSCFAELKEQWIFFILLQFANGVLGRLPNKRL